MNKIKFNICFFNSSKTWGGGEKWHFDVASNLDKENFKTVLFSNPDSDLLKKARENKIETREFYVSNLSFLNPIKVTKLTKIFKKYSFDTIILNLPSDLKLAGRAAKMAGIKRIIYRRGSAIPIKNNFFNRYLFKNIVTEIITNSEETKKTIFKNNNRLFNKQKVHVIYNGVDLLRFPVKTSAKSQYGQRCEIAIGNIGRLDPQKAQHYLIELSVKLKELGIEHKIKIAGDGPLKQKLKNSIAENNLKRQVQLVGFQEDIPAFLDTIDIFVLTSRWEGFGYVLAEAMAAYKPVIAFDLSSNSELIEHKQNGCLIRPFDISEMANAVRELIIDEKMYERFALNGRKKVEELFTKEKMLEKVSVFLMNNNY